VLTVSAVAGRHDNHVGDEDFAKIAPSHGSRPAPTANDHDPHVPSLRSPADAASPSTAASSRLINR